MLANPYRGDRFPQEIISQCVWLYFNFALSLRDVELRMAFHGVLLTYETVRNWCDKFGPSYAAQLKRRRPKLGDKWHLDEVFWKIHGVQHDRWRAVDQHGTVIAILVQPKRDRRAAILFFRKLLRTTKRQPRVIITDKLRSDGAAKRVVLPRVVHRPSRYLNHRAENSPQPTRPRERRLRRFQSPGPAQRFLEVHDLIAPHFRPKRHLLSAAHYRAEREQQFQVWHQIINV